MTFNVRDCVNQCLQEGCQWKEKEVEIQRLRKRVAHLESVTGRLADHSAKEFREALHPTL